MRIVRQVWIVGAGWLSLLTMPAGAATITVTTPADNATSPPNGSLRAVMLAAAPGDTINFACGSPCIIMLAAALPPIVQDLTIDGGTFGTVIIDGGNQFPGFFVDAGTVNIANLTIENATAQGGAGAFSGGGGGLGAGGGLFVNNATAIVQVSGVLFQNCSAIGGNGDPGEPGGGGGGGGGLYFGGGAWAGASGGAGGGGVLSSGSGSNTNIGGDGGNGGGGGGAGAVGGGTGGAGFATNAGGFNGGPGSGNTGAVGGAGGFGGGGGGGQADTFAGAGGAGGFGGGGGAGGAGSTGGATGGTGGAGGPGSGGGGGGDAEGGTNGSGGSGGALATLHGGAGGAAIGDNGGAGGGGAAAGPAIFVNQGSVTITGSNSIGQSATAGTGASNGTSDATPVFNFEGMVNGSSTTGPIAEALGGPTGVSSQVSVTETGFVRNRVTGIWSSTMTVTNVGVNPIAGPVQVLFTNLTAGVNLKNNTGMYQGAPFLTVSAGSIAPGASVSVSIQFTNPSISLIQFTPTTDTGLL